MAIFTKLHRSEQADIASQRLEKPVLHDDRGKIHILRDTLPRTIRPCDGHHVIVNMPDAGDAGHRLTNGDDVVISTH